jgi:hypothetical protein
LIRGGVSSKEVEDSLLTGPCVIEEKRFSDAAAPIEQGKSRLATLGKRPERRDFARAIDQFAHMEMRLT